MLIAAIVVLVLALGLIGYLLWRTHRPLSAADYTFALTPVFVGMLIVARWPHDALADALALVLVLIGVYCAYRLYAER